MDLTCATVNGQPADLLDAQGRLVVTPHALTLDGQRNVPADLRPSESLHAFLRRHVPGIDSGAWSVMISGHVVPCEMWARTYPKEGQLIACRASVGKAAVSLIAVAALSYFTFGFGAATAGMWGAGAVAGAWGGMAALGVYMAGSMLINRVLAPKVPKPGEAAQAKPFYSLSSQRNTARLYEPLPALFGEMRVTPDLAGQPYTVFEGDDQYLCMVLLGGINVHSVSDLAIGDTPLSSYEDVEVYYTGFPGHPDQTIPFYSNVDMVAGGELENNGAWITRTGSAGAVVMQVDIEGRLYDVDGSGNIKSNSVPLFVEYRAVGAGSWLTFATQTLTNASMDVVRRTLSLPVPAGQYEVRVRLGAPTWSEGAGKDECSFTFQSLKSIQPDATNYAQWGAIGIKIRATGQLSGGLDTVRATFRAKPMPIWDGTGWATATSRENGLANPGAIELLHLRGIRDGDGNLQWGFGFDDAQIDMDRIKAFTLHCTAQGYQYDKWQTAAVSCGDFADEVALAGMGQFTWQDGSRPGVSYVASGQPIGGVVNMANIIRASFSVGFALSTAADGIEYQYLDRTDWETKTLRVAAPGVTTMLNPATVRGEGVSSEAHAAVLARYHLAQSLFQFKTINYGADIESLDYRRLSVLSLSHDLTQWGYSGRLMACEVVAGAIVLTLDEPVPPMSTPHIGLRLPGERDYLVFQVQPLAAESDQLTLIGDWPEDVDMPGEGADNPAHDTLWCCDFKATPGYRVRVVSMEPESDLKGAAVTCVPEGPELWDYVLNGTYTPAPSGSALPQLAPPEASNIRVVEAVHLQGDTEWYELSCIWDVAGAFDHAQVWAARDGAELRLVDGNAQARSTFRISGGGNWLIQVIPFDASGRAGTAASKLYITNQVGLAPWNPNTFAVQAADNGLRRYVWAYTSDRPATLAGVQIRYRAGTTPATAEDWDAMTPLGDASDIYTAQFELTRPDAAGNYTFALRAINTSGQLAAGVKSYTANLPDPFGDISAPDMTPPPLVTGLSAIAGLAVVMVEWTTPSYAAGHGHARTEVWAGETNIVGAAEKVAEGYGGPVAFAAETGTTLYIWARNVSVDGVPGSFTASPISVTTGKVGSGDLGTGVVQDGHVANLSAAKLTAGDGTIGGLLKSSNFVTGSAGWQFKPDGTAELSGATFRGTIYATAGQIGGVTLNANGLSAGGVNITANALNSGAFVGYAWPASGTGFHLGPNGLLLGNANAGKYLQVAADGNIYAPNFSIVDGAITTPGFTVAANGAFTLGAGTVKSVNIENLTIGTEKVAFDSITRAYGVNGGQISLPSGANWVTCTSLTVTLAAGQSIINMAISIQGSTDYVVMRILVNGSLLTSWMGSSGFFVHAVSAGTVTYTLQAQDQLAAGRLVVSSALTVLNRLR